MSRTCVSAEKHPYTTAAFWANQDNWFWEPKCKDYTGLAYTPKAKERFWGIVAQAQKELLKKNRSNSIIWANKLK